MNRVCMYANLMECPVLASFPVAVSVGLRAFLDSSVGLEISPTSFCLRRFFALALFPKRARLDLRGVSTMTPLQIGQLLLVHVLLCTETF